VKVEDFLNLSLVSAIPFSNAVLIELDP